MPVLFLSSLMGALAACMGSFLGRILIVLGIGFVTYKGTAAGIDVVKSQVITGVSSLSADALGLVGYLWLDKGLTIIFSAVAAAVAMKGLGGAVKKMVFK